MPSLTGLDAKRDLRGQRGRAASERRLLRRDVRGDRRRHAVGALRDLPVEGRRARARLVDALVERRRAGVQVRVLVDADGGKQMGRDAQNAGCATPAASSQLHHPRHIRNIGVFNERDHRKLVVIDGRVALVGGHCIVDSWLRRRAGLRPRARPRRAAARSGGARGAGGVQRELGRGHRRAVRRRRRLSRAAERAGDVAGARREREGRRLGAGGEDPAPPGGVRRAQARPGSRTRISCPMPKRSRRCARRSSAASTCA